MRDQYFYEVSCSADDCHRAVWGIQQFWLHPKEFLPLLSTRSVTAMHPDSRNPGNPTLLNRRAGLLSTLRSDLVINLLPQLGQLVKRLAVDDGSFAASRFE